MCLGTKAQLISHCMINLKEGSLCSERGLRKLCMTSKWESHFPKLFEYNLRNDYFLWTRRDLVQMPLLQAHLCVLSQSSKSSYNRCRQDSLRHHNAYTRKFILKYNPNLLYWNSRYKRVILPILDMGKSTLPALHSSFARLSHVLCWGRSQIIDTPCSCCSAMSSLKLDFPATGDNTTMPSKMEGLQHTSYIQ